MIILVKDYGYGNLQIHGVTMLTSVARAREAASQDSRCVALPESQMDWVSENAFVMSNRLKDLG